MGHFRLGVEMMMCLEREEEDAEEDDEEEEKVMMVLVVEKEVKEEGKEEKLRRWEERSYRPEQHRRAGVMHWACLKGAVFERAASRAAPHA